MHVSAFSPEIYRLLPAPVGARHAEYSMIFSADDEPGKPSARLLQIALDAARLAQHADMAEVSSRLKQGPYYPDVWPGEHYKLLAALVAVLQPATVIEIGTYTGLSALALTKYLPPAARLYTFDILPWKHFGDTCLRDEDFAAGRITQIVEDLGDPAVCERHRETLQGASLIFVDAAKDGICEPRLLANLRTLKFHAPPIFVFDDIRLWSMLKIWREISMPKIDLTSFGHWSGTGLVEWGS